MSISRSQFLSMSAPLRQSITLPLSSEEPYTSNPFALKTKTQLWFRLRKYIRHFTLDLLIKAIKLVPIK